MIYSAGVSAAIAAAGPGPANAAWAGSKIKYNINLGGKMQKFIGTKIIKAISMNLGVYNNFKGWEIPKDEDPTKEGYLVGYPGADGKFDGDKQDGCHYISWSPADVFEASYVLLDGMSEEELEKELNKKGLNAPRLSPKQINSVIVGETFTVLPSGKCMICEITLRNGFTVRGESSCVSKENFDKDIGVKVSREDARKKIWGFEAYLLQQILYNDSQAILFK